MMKSSLKKALKMLPLPLKKGRRLQLIDDLGTLKDAHPTFFSENLTLEEMQD